MVTTNTSTTGSGNAAAASAVSSLYTSLGVGSGIDLAALATNLAAAEFAAKSDALTSKGSTLDTRISAASTLRSLMTNLASSVTARIGEGDVSPQPTIANGAVATATTSGTTTPSGRYSLEVTALASSQTLVSPAYSSGTALVGSGTLTLRFGIITGAGTGTSFSEDSGHAAIPVTVPSGATLADVASAINGANAGVSAYVANTTSGAKLVLKGQTGADNAFVLDANEDPSDPGLSNLGWGVSDGAARRLQSAGDASLSIDGLPVSSASNTLTDALPGVTLKLTGTNPGAPTDVTFADPGSAITTVMTDLTTALNSVMGELNTDMAVGSGALVADGGARALRAAMSRLTNQVVMSNAAVGAPSTLADLGLSIERDGSFSLDTKRLAATLKANPQAAAAMFTTGVSGVSATIAALATQTTDVADPGSLAGSIAQLTVARIKLTTDQTQLATDQETLREQFVSRFATSDTLITTYRSTLTFLQNQIAAWNSSS